MATIVNNPPAQNNNSGNNMGVIIGIIVILVLAIVFVMYGLPMLQQAAPSTQVTIPDQIDVNVNQGGN